MTTDQRGSLTMTGSRRDHREVDLPPAAGHTRGMRGTRDAGRDGGGDGLVEHAGNDVLLAQLPAPDAAGDRSRRRDLHLVVHGPCTRVEQSAEEAGEAQDVVDLVGVV